MANPQVHNVRFYKPKPKAIYCMALEPRESKLAVSRSDASIEIWNLTDAPFIERRLASSTKNFSVEGLAWCDSRLFSVGLHGLLVEYDLYKLDVKGRAAVTGEAAFCLDVNGEKTRIAVGTEQGFLNIFEIGEDEVLFEKFLDRQEGRILCLKFDRTGQFIVSGSMDAIRVWNVNTNQALHKMITGRSEQNRPTIVWCLAVTSDFTVLSGDSRGTLTVWDGRVGAQLDSYQSHRADVLALALSEDEDTLVCGGVDPNLVSYVRIKVKGGTAAKWVRSVQRKIHQHDVRALTLNDRKLYSGGVDGYLGCSYHPPKTLLKYPPLLQGSCANVARTSRRILLRHAKFVEVYNLGVGSREKEKHTGLYPVRKAPKKLVVLQNVKGEEGDSKKEGIICAAISDRGDLIVYGTRLGVRVLRFVVEEEKVELVPIRMLDSSVSLVFTSSGRLITAPSEGDLHVTEFDNYQPLLVQKVQTQPHLVDTITLLDTSNDFLVGGDVQGNVAVWVWRDRQYHFHCKLPKYHPFATALAVHPSLPNLVVAYSDCKVIEFDLEQKELTSFSKSLNVNPPKQWTSRYFAIRNITFDPRLDHVIIFHDDECVVVVDKKNLMEEEDADVKGPKIARNDKDIHGQAVRVVKKYKHLVDLTWLSDNEMVAVEVSSLSLLQQLPPCFVQNTFGRK